MYPYIIQGSNITIMIDSDVHTVGPTHVQYERVRQAIKEGDWDTLKECITPSALFRDFDCSDTIKIENDTLTYKGKSMHSSLATRVIDMVREGFDAAPMVMFMENLMNNPSHRAVMELYGFLETNSLPITSDGHFLAYKRVRSDYRDIYTGTIDNSVGQVVEMERWEVDDDKGRTCSHGLHFCSKEYLKYFGRHNDPIMILKINPADVVSIPVDYNNTKGRCCRYEVIAQLGGTPDAPDDDGYKSAVYEHTPLGDDCCGAGCHECDDEPEECGDCGLDMVDGTCDDPYCPPNGGEDDICEHYQCDHDHDCAEHECHD